ncbi:NUDIX hydrolase [Pilimelia columellifera subsp. columellifera]|uniref:NUDIX hydrolase n=1 Tax=Pilimelia columellifera subsp. columellifera TaxID=706583 RepID=A0ABP6B0Q6_9ACTN
MPDGYVVVGSTDRFAGRIFSVVSDEVRMPDGGVATRDYLRHPGAVAVIAVDDAGAVVLLGHYRHPVRRRLWEAPAGLRDVVDEPAVRTAQRELAEETDLTAGSWTPLLRLHPSPGCSSEEIEVFLARDLADAPGERPPRRGEEADLIVERIAMPRALSMIDSGEITNGVTVAGLLAADRRLRAAAQVAR